MNPPIYPDALLLHMQELISWAKIQPDNGNSLLAMHEILQSMLDQIEDAIAINCKPTPLPQEVVVALTRADELLGNNQPE